MNNICKYCKFCEERRFDIRSKIQNYYLGKEYKYFCKFMPKEIEIKEDNWCGQFKSKFNNEEY